MEKALVFFVLLVILNPKFTVMTESDHYFAGIGSKITFKLIVKNKADKPLSLDLKLVPVADASRYFAEYRVWPNEIKVSLEPHGLAIYNVRVTSNAAIRIDIYAIWSGGKAKLCRIDFYAEEKEPRFLEETNYIALLLLITLSAYLGVWLWRRLLLVRRYRV